MIAQLTSALEIVTCVVIFLATGAAVLLGGRPLVQLIRRQEARYTAVVQGTLLYNVSGRVVTVLCAIVMIMLAAIGYLAVGLIGAMGGLLLGAVVPSLVLRVLLRRRLRRLESQLVSGIQTLASGVRAGLNLVQSMELVARDGPIPLKQEFAHLLREYEYGTPLDEAMSNTASRIGSGDFRLLFAALQTHRERGGDLSATLDRIADSIREIQRLENRVKTLTAQGRANARFLAMLVGGVLVVLYFIEPDSVRMLFTDDMGKVILIGIVALMIIGFIWIRKIVAIDI